jgi:Protein kinase domain/PEGA domain
MKPPSMTAGLALALLLPAVGAAEDWDEAYRSGLVALARGDNARAADAFRRAIAMRREPGRNVPTYGTNVEPRYFPYLKLAEASLALGQLEAAREALERSASFGALESPDERQKLAARVEAAAAQRRSPSPSALPAAVPSPTAIVVTPTPTPAPTPAPVTAPPAAAVPSAPSPAPREGSLARPPAERPARSSGEPPASPRAAAATAPEAAGGTLEVISQPPGAATYIDDEPVGATDPQTGRLVKSDLPPGRHRVRVAHAGHEDAVRDVDVVRGGAVRFHATLTPVPAGSPAAGPGLIVFALVAIGLVAVFAWIALRRPEAASVPASTGPGALAPRPTPSGQANPGARSDSLGQEWFGDYRLLEMLGRGGMASVYKAQRRGEVSALKRPLAHLLDDPQFRERFLREAEIGRALNHPNIIRILERGAVGAVPYFTMELLPGQTLQAHVAGHGATAPQAAVAIVVQVAEALDFAHSKGVVHRDLKPSNVMLRPDGTAKVMDFGIARARRFEGMTATDAFLGTPDYVAPEMIDGRGTDARSDLYALGLILFELLTGQRTFTGETSFAILKKHSSEEPPAPSRLERAVPPELDSIVLRLLRKNPEDRPASAEALVLELRDWLNRAA